jgi:hypothetical protein
MSSYKGYYIVLNKGNSKKRRFTMKKMLVVIIALVLACTYAYAGGELNPDFTKEYPNSKGTVTFNHQLHAEVLGECADCHAQLKAFGDIVDKKFGHKVCKTCHKDNIQSAPNAPVACTGCHVR